MKRMCVKCKYQSFDMDMDFFCVAPKVMEDNIFGLFLRSARDKKGPCGPDGKLFVRASKQILKARGEV